MCYNQISATSSTEPQKRFREVTCWNAVICYTLLCYVMLYFDFVIQQLHWLRPLASYCNCVLLLLLQAFYSSCNKIWWQGQGRIFWRGEYGSHAQFSVKDVKRALRVEIHAHIGVPLGVQHYPQSHSGVVHSLCCFEHHSSNILKKKENVELFADNKTWPQNFSVFFKYV